jgi:hypothetical protein
VSETATPLRLAVDPRFQDRERQPGLDLLRALAIIVVVIYHAALFGFRLPGRVDRFGWIGVDLFFVLSGYLIGGQLLAPLARDQSIKLGRFFARRALRIMPAYLVVLAIYFLLPSWREYPEMSQPLWKFLLSVQNIGLHGGTAFSHAWSLAVEDQFYLCLPFILLLANRWPRAVLLIPCVIVFGGIFLRTFLAWQNPAADFGVSFRAFQAWIYYPTWTRLDPLVFGVGLAAIEKFRPTWWERLTNYAVWLWLPGLVLIFYALYLGEGDYLAVPAHRSRNGRATCLRRQPPIAVSSSRNSGRRVRGQHRLQRISDPKTRDPFRCGVLHDTQHRTHVRFSSCSRGNLRLRRRHNSLSCRRTPISPTPPPHCTAEVWFNHGSHG